MLIEGAIRPKGQGVNFTRETWCHLIASRPEFRRPSARQIRNPFTGATKTVQAPADAAEVMLEGHSVGSVSWSQSDEKLVNVSIEPAGLSLVLEWAVVLGGEFFQHSDGEAGAPPASGR